MQNKIDDCMLKVILKLIEKQIYLIYLNVQHDKNIQINDKNIRTFIFSRILTLSFASKMNNNLFDLKITNFN